MDEKKESEQVRPNDEDEPLYPPVLPAWTRGIFSAEPPKGYGDISFDPTVKAHKRVTETREPTVLDIQALRLLKGMFPGRRIPGTYNCTYGSCSCGGTLCRWDDHPFI